MQRVKQTALEELLKLEQQLDAKQALELEIQHLKVKLEVVKHILCEELPDKSDLIEELELLNQTMIIKERTINDELQGARKELINVNDLID
jgi:hypothetical protein